MKLITATLAALALCATAFASGETVRVHFSTPVMIGEKVLPAGDVTFHVNHGTSSLLLTVHAENGESAAVVVNRLHESEAPNNTSVILGRSGNALKFERLWLSNGAGFGVVDTQ